ncbi:MAG: aminoglycoside phosphotransferase family protein [Acidimicrobiia bacterium]|nr:aminoglycoside phosphotransferase family protein [Acidimicrobiia bacterium]MDX2466423.1 aminoglycoside phosphotransferase family protein [Acidimicrobiia bacterium]
MKPIEVAQKLAGGGRVHELTGMERGQSANRVYRIWVGESTRIAKIYGTPARERREIHALEALASLSGTPQLIDRGLEDDIHWAIFEDAGRWNLGTLPENPGLARKAGEILRTVHETSSEKISNLSRGMDQEWVAVDFLSTLRRLERYRRRLELSGDLLNNARDVRPPFASDPRSAHTNPAPDNFVVDDAGKITLITWEWATVAPMEWDLSKATWLLGLHAGPLAAVGFQEGYGRTLDQYQLDRWIVYHAAMTLVFRVERSMDAAIGTHDLYLSEFRRAVAASTLNDD